MASSSGLLQKIKEKDQVKCVLSASLHDVNFRRCYPIRRQQPRLMRTTHEEPIEIEFTGKTCPWT